MHRWESFDQFLAEAEQAESDHARQQLVDELLDERPEWPWVEGSRATFIYAKMGVNHVALNMDNIQGDPPLAPMKRLNGTTLYYLRRRFEQDDLLDYMLAIDDPMTPLAKEKDIVGRVARHWRVDPRNPHRITTAQTDVSVLKMPYARPFPDWRQMPDVPRGRIYEHSFNSVQMNFTGRKLWVYTPPGYDPNGGIMYPLLILLDGQWMVGPLQVPYIVDTLIKHGRMEPVIIAMKQSGSESDRVRDYISNDRHYAALLTELLPFLQTQYLIDSVNLGVGGVGVGAIAAAHASLKNPAVFSHLMMISPPLGKGVAEEKLLEYTQRFGDVPLLPRRIFQSVGKYEARSRFYLPGRALAVLLMQRQATMKDVNYRFVEIGSGHSLAAFKSILPEAISHCFPGLAWK